MDMNIERIKMPAPIQPPAARALGRLRAPVPAMTQTMLKKADMLEPWLGRSAWRSA